MAAPERYSPSNPAAFACSAGLSVMGAGKLDDAGAGEQRAEPLARGGGWKVVGDEVGHGKSPFLRPIADRRAEEQGGGDAGAAVGRLWARGLGSSVRRGGKARR